VQSLHVALNSLSQLNTPEAVEVVRGLLRHYHDDLMVGLAAIRALEQMHATSAIPDLISLAKERNNTTSNSAIEALGHFGDASAAVIPWLEEVIRDPQSSITLRTASEEALDAIRKDLHRVDPATRPVRRQAGFVLPELLIAIGALALAVVPGKV